ncbi:RNA polymerase II subunit 5-mediating protein homolog [Takifugu rubripes]|uniref:RNA polymerase II subunit 5-mediating protein homolog n=1 Tax=Takifugu rubripes TaxID=31033 RepID=UPI0011456AC2|nr:RNA polymerase II subunit 5-mediating protein homolog [Takifugu rubripes]
MTSQQMAKTMRPEKVLEYLVQENDIHYQHYCAMRELLLSYKLPVSMLKTTDEPQAFFNKLYLSYTNPPSTVGSRIVEDTSELIEEVIKNNQEIRGFNARMSKEVVGFVNIYNDWIMDKLCKDESSSPACWNSMNQTMKRLVQEEEERKAENANLEGELFILNEKRETRERELSALRTKVKLQKDLRSANEMISNHGKIHSCCEEKLKKRKEKSLPKKILEFFYKQLRRKRQSWEENVRKKKVTRDMAQDVENSDDDTENSDEDVENSDDDTENSDDDVGNSDDDVGNSDEEVENSDDDVENSYKLMENSDEDVGNS